MYVFVAYVSVRKYIHILLECWVVITNRSMCGTYLFEYYISFVSIHIFVKYTLSTHGGALDYNNRICGAVCGSHLCKRSVIGTKTLTSNPGSRNSRHLHRYFGGRCIRIYICKHIWICQVYIYLVYLLLLKIHLFLGWEVKVVIIYGSTCTFAENASYTGVEKSSYIKVHI